MMLRLLMTFMAITSADLAQQQKGPITQNTGGVCSQAVVAGGNVTITCQDLDESQRQILLKVPALLDQILKKQVDEKLVVEKLDEVLKGQNIVLKELLTLREHAAPRIITPENRKAIVAELERFKGQEYTVGSVSQDKEAFDFATAIQEMLTAAGWKASDTSLGRLMQVGQPQTGIELSAASANSQPGLALLNALHSRGVEIKGTLAPTLPAGQVRIQVYSKGHN